MLRESLRIHTRPYHERIEQALDLPGSVRNREDFQRLLVRFYGFYLPHEVRLRSYTSALDAFGIELGKRLKSDKIRDDLLSLGMSKDAIGTLPFCLDLPELRTLGHALGSLYVLEGSTLGSQVIARAFNETIDLDIVSAMRFLSGYGPSTGSMWRSFVSALDAARLEPEDLAAAHEGAVHTFQSLERWMCGFIRPDCWQPLQVVRPNNSI
jgi:heme oxygenase (biliverdin-IX-beta and delta-forming)